MRYILSISILLISPLVAYGSIEISEIMYDLEGSDTDREWIEIYNSGSETIDITLWKLREADTNHSLTSAQGGNNLSPGGYAIIVDSFDKFLLDYPGFSGSVFDSSFSLSNTGETISMRDPSLNDISVVSYDSTLGALGDGNSLQKISGSFKPGKPTPGSTNSVSVVLSPETNEPSSDGQNNQTTTQTSSSNTQNDYVELRLYPNAGLDRTVIVGSLNEFSGSALGIKKEPLSNARYVWTFGDGATKEGKSILHTYKHPGEYVLALTVSSGEYTGTDRAIITVVEADIKISSSVKGGDGFTALRNDSGHDIDLSGWIIKSGSYSFTIPKNTIILSKKELKFPNDVTGLIDLTIPPTLHYQNGSLVENSTGSILATKATSFSNDVSPNFEENKKSITPTPKPIVVSKIDSNEGNIDEPIDERSEMSASVNEAVSEESGKIKWFVFLGSIILVAIAGYFVVNGRSKKEADTYEIVE